MATRIILFLLTCFASFAQITNVNIGTSANDNAGDSLRTAFSKLNTNTAWLASQLGSATNGALVLSNSAFAAITSASNTLNSSKFSRPSGSATLYTLGDSIANGASSTTFAQSWPALFAAANGLTEQRLAYGSGRIIDYYWQSQPPFIYTNGYSSAVATAPSSITGTQVWAVGMGDYNGMRDYGTTAAYQEFSKAGFLSLGVALAVTNKSLASAATASGSWTANTNLGGFVTATSSTATLTFTNIVGDTVYVAYIVTATNDFGSVSIAVNGTNYGTFAATGGYGNRTWDNGTDANIPTYISPAGNGKLWYMPRVVRIPLGMSSKHTVVVTATGASVSTPSGVLWVAGNGQRRTIQNTGPIVLFSGTLRQATYTGSGSDLAAGQFAGNIRDVVDTLRGDGLAVYYVPSEQWFNEFTEMSGDNVHPDDDGHVSISQAFHDVYSTLYNPRTAQSRAGYIPSGIAIGRSPAFSGTVRLPQASSFVWRDANAFDGLYATNVGRGITFMLPNSSGSVYRSLALKGDAFPISELSLAEGTAGSPVGMLVHGRNSLSSDDYVYTQIGVTNNSSGTAGYKAIYIPIVEVAAGSGNKIAIEVEKGGRDVFRVTDGGRILVDSADGLATTSRFGVANDSSKLVTINYSGTGNRAMDLSGDSIDVTQNDGTSTKNTLKVQATGGGVVFGVTGVTNSAIEWTGVSTGTDRRLSLYGNAIQVVQNSSSGTAQNLALQFSGGDVVVGSSTSTGLRLRSSSGAAIFSGTGSPEAAVTAPVGSLFLRTDGGAGSTLYVKESGTGNTGWAAK